MMMMVMHAVAVLHGTEFQKSEKDYALKSNYFNECNFQTTQQKIKEHKVYEREQ